MTPLKYYLAIATICLNANNVMAQNNEIKSEQIASLQVVAGTDWLKMPVITLGGDKPINISFDDLTHEGRRYVYRLDHCEADWTTSTELFDSDYCDGFADGNTIDDNEESINTNTLYTHYSFQIPNEKCRIKKSGNYRVTVYDENEGDTVFSACFMVVELWQCLNLKSGTRDSRGRIAERQMGNRKTQLAPAIHHPLRNEMGA